MSKMKVIPSLTTLELDAENRVVTLKANEQHVSLRLVDGHLVPDDRTFLDASSPDPDTLGLRLAMASGVLHMAVWLRDPNEENEKELRSMHESFNEVMKRAPEQAVVMAIENGLSVLEKALEAARRPATPEVEMKPTDVTLTMHFAQRAVKIACGDAYVVLTEVPSDEEGAKAINAVEEVGDIGSNEHRNMRLTFMAIREQIKVYLTGDDDAAAKIGPQMLAAAEGWNTVKEEQPDMAQSLVPALLEGSVQLNALPVTVDSEQADALIKRYEAGEMSMDDLHKALGTENTGPVH